MLDNGENVNEELGNEMSVKYTAILRNWLPVPTSSGLYYVGQVYKDKKKRFEDGVYIQTSPVFKTYQMGANKDEKNVIFIETLNSVYRLEGEMADEVV